MKQGQMQKDKNSKRKSRKFSSKKSNYKRINRVRRLSKEKNVRRSKNRNSRRNSNRKSRRINRNNKKTRRRKSKKLIKGGRSMKQMFIEEWIQEFTSNQGDIGATWNALLPGGDSITIEAFNKLGYTGDYQAKLKQAIQPIIPSNASSLAANPATASTTAPSAPTDSSAPTTGPTPTSIDPNATLFTNDMEPGLYHLYTPNTKGKGTYYIYLIDAKSDEQGNFGKGTKIYYVHLESDKEISYTEPGKKRRWRKDTAASREVIEGSKFDYKILDMSDLLARVDPESSESKLYCESIETPSFNQRLPDKMCQLHPKAELLCLYFVGITVGKNQKYVRFAYPKPNQEKITKHMVYHTCDEIIKLGDNPVFQLVSCNQPYNSQPARKMALGISGQILTTNEIIRPQADPFAELHEYLVPFDEKSNHTHHYLKITANSGEKVFEYADGELSDSTNIASSPVFYARWRELNETSKAYIRIPLFSHQNTTWKDIFFCKGNSDRPDISIHRGIREHKKAQKDLLQLYDSTEYNTAMRKLLLRIDNDATNADLVLVVSRLCDTGRAAENAVAGNGIVACNPVTLVMLNEIVSGQSYTLDPAAAAHVLGAPNGTGGLQTTADIGGALVGEQIVILNEINAVLQARKNREDKVNGFKVAFVPSRWKLWFEAVKEEMGTNFENCESEIRCLPKFGEKDHRGVNGFDQEDTAHTAMGSLTAKGSKSFINKAALATYNQRFCETFKDEQQIEGLDLSLLVTKRTYLGLCTMWIGPETAPPVTAAAGYTDARSLLGRSQRYGLTWCLDQHLEARRFTKHDALNTVHLRETCIGIFPGAAGNDPTGPPPTGGIFTIPDGGAGVANPLRGRWTQANQYLLNTLPDYPGRANVAGLSDNTGVNLDEVLSIVKTYGYLGCGYSNNNFHGELEAAINNIYKNITGSLHNVTPLFNNININSYNGVDGNALPMNPPTNLGGTDCPLDDAAKGGEPIYPAFGIPLPILSLVKIG